MSKYVSFDIGGTTVKYAIVDDEGTITDKAAFDTDQHDAEAMIDKLVAVVTQFRGQADIAGIGISAPGIVRRDGFMVTGGAIQAFNAFPLAATLESATGLPVTVENDANAAAIAEQWLGNAQNVDDYLTIVLGTGVGGGIIINGDVYRGAHGMAGEFGWNITHDIDLTLPLEAQSINQRGAVQAGLVRRYNLACQQVNADAELIGDARVILDRAWNGDTLAERIVNEFKQDVTIMLLNLFADFDPELILIGGGISANDRFMKELQATINEYLARHESLDRIKDTALGRVKTAKLRNDAGLIGAAYGIRRKLQQP
ncbi:MULTISPECIES: ROK family protein [Lacticaseibacillus]|uniref:ROK family protein n=2 Tax=Lacticaseibacillus TaxID=2759736 RepID=A0ABW4CLY0_9LACO|nr:MULTISPECIES: ROK family protein [Lacticaseibacillus]